MFRLKKLVPRAAAFAMALVLICTGILDNLYFMSFRLTGDISRTVTAEAATTGTVNADKFSWDNALVYFLLTDRFKNGNPSNDHSYGRGLDKSGNVVQGVDDRATFHGGDFKGITETIKDGYFNNLGVNALWISAPYEQIHGYIVGSGDTPSFAHYSYHGYYVLDYTNTDANFGTAEEFQELVDTAHEHGLRVIIDIVLNHAGYNSLYDMNEFGFGDVKTGWDDYYYTMTNVNNGDYHSYIDYETDKEKWSKWWGPDWVRAGLPGYDEGGGDNYTHPLEGLPDFKTESTKTVGIPAFLEKKWKDEGRYDKEVNELKAYLDAHSYPMTVTNCISYWLSTWVRDYGVDGFRCDTAKHVENKSWKTLETMCTEALKTWKTNNPDKKLDDLEFWMTGEAWDHGVGYDEYYTAGGFDSMINFETWGGGVLASGSIEGTYAGYASSVNTKPDFNILSFLSSHDSVLTRGDMVYIGSAFLLLPGGVQIYYGDETNRPMVDGIPNDGNGKAGHSLRSDMNWDDMDETVLAHWQKVGTFRNSHVAVGAGENASVDATSGHAFTRTYSKGDVKDRVAFCLGASKNSEVTIDVSSVWSDGDNVVNYYDASAAVVTDGKVTFNSGANGTILIGDPDGKPLISFKGKPKFKGTQQVTVSLEDAESAVVSVDGGSKFIVEDGDAFVIGETAYEGDTISISYSATNEKGTTSGKATFYKAFADENIDDNEDDNNDDNQEKGLVRVKMSDGSAPYLYAWKDEETKYTSAWPGTLLTEKDEEGYYIYNIDTTGKFNIIFNGGEGSGKTADIEGLSGKVTFEVQSGFGSYKQTGGKQDIPVVNNTITIRVKPYSPSSPAPHLHVWDDSTAYNGGFPGKQLTEKDDDGNWLFVLEGVASVNCIVNGGNNQVQSDNITGITGEALITVKSEDYKQCTVEKTPKVESKYALMKKEAKSVKNMVEADYTTESWEKLYSYIDKAEELIALGEEEADKAQVETAYNNIVSAKGKLVLVAPKVTMAQTGNKSISGIAPCDSTVEINVDGKNYTAKADGVTGIWSVTADSAITSSSTIKASCKRDGLSSVTGTYPVNDSIVTGNGKVTVKYVDASGAELAASKTLTGMVGSSYMTVASAVPGYTLSATPANARGTYTEAEITVNYVYRKDSDPVETGKVIIKYVNEEGTEIADTKTKVGTVGAAYTTTAVKISGYTLKTAPDNAKGTFTKEDITVTYVYKVGDDPVVTGKVIVKYEDEAGAELKEAVTLTGNVGETYTTSSASIEGYTLKATPDNATGLYTKEDITVTYVYKKNDIPADKGKVIVKYLDEEGASIKEDVIMTGDVGASYTTAAATVEGYTLKTTPDNAAGTYTKQDITVTYIYKKENDIPIEKGKVIVKYVNESGTEIKEALTLTGNVGVGYETTAAVIEGYTLKVTPDNAAGKYTKEDITVTYVYKKDTGKVTVRYVDEEGTEIKAADILTGDVGAAYTTAAATVEGYILKTTPDNAAGTYTKQDITVTYVYHSEQGPVDKGKVIIKYVDESGKEIKESQTTTGNVGVGYITEAAVIEGYSLKKAPENAAGTYTKEDITVTYVYAKDEIPVDKGKVIVKFVDESGKEIKGTETITGDVGTAYITEAAKVNGYILKTTPENASGTYTKEDITVIYVYSKEEVPVGTGKVIVKYVDESGKEIKGTETKTGDVGTAYTTSAAKVDGYILKTTPKNASGTYTKEDITVIYVYSKEEIPIGTGTVIVKYVDETGEEIEETGILTGNVGDTYTTEAIQIPGYTLKVTPSNATGKYEEEDITVTYIYKKNGTVKVDKTFRKMSARVSKTTKTSNKVVWNKVKGADGYIVYGGTANKNLRQLKKQKSTAFTHKKLKKGTYYKYSIKAYKLVNGKKVVIAVSKVVYSTTDGGKYGNAKSIKVNKTTVKLKKGRTFKIKTKVVKKNRKIKSYRGVAFESSNTKVATVSSKGTIKAKKKGNCTIYVYTQNGVYKKIKLTVK